MEHLTNDEIIKKLSSYKQLSEANQPYKNIEVLDVIKTNKDGTKLFWKGGIQYYIIKLNAQNPTGKNLAIKLLKKEKFKEALNTNLSISLRIEKATNLRKGMLGTLVMEQVNLSNGNKILMPYKFKVMEQIKASKSDFDSLLNATKIQNNTIKNKPITQKERVKIGSPKETKKEPLPKRILGSILVIIFLLPFLYYIINQLLILPSILSELFKMLFPIAGLFGVIAVMIRLSSKNSKR